MNETFKRWLSDGTSWIAVFENKALDSGGAGHRIALCYDIQDYDKATIGRDRAPDTRLTTGWKYILIAKCKTVDEALEMMSS